MAIPQSKTDDRLTMSGLERQMALQEAHRAPILGASAVLKSFHVLYREGQTSYWRKSDSVTTAKSKVILLCDPYA